MVIVIILLFVLLFISLFLLFFFCSLLKNTLVAAPWVPLNNKVIERMLKLAGIGPSDVLYDLGSGDGRVIIAAAKKYKIKTVGIENSWPLWFWSAVNLYLFGLKKSTKVQYDNFFKADLSKATIVVFYLLPKVIDKLLPKLKQNLRPRTKIISASFKINGLTPIKIDQPTPKDMPLYLYQL